MRGMLLAATVFSSLSGQALSKDCSSLVASMCDGTVVDDSRLRRTLKVDVKPPAYAVGDRFPVEERSLLLNPTRYKLPKVDGAWRYYAMEGVVYRVDNASAMVLDVINDNRTWRLR